MSDPDFRAFIADLLDDLAHHIDAGATTEGWLRFAAHWSDRADDAQSARALGGDLMDRTRVLSRLDRAEARLREIGGDDADM